MCPVQKWPMEIIIVYRVERWPTVLNKVGQKVTESKSSNVVELTKTPQPILLLQIVQIDLAKLLNMISHPLWC